MKRFWAAGLIALVAVFIAAACGGDEAATPTVAPTATTTTPPESTATPTRAASPAQDATPTPETTRTLKPTPTEMPSPTPETTGPSAPTGAMYTWEVSTIDTIGGKPSLAVAPDGIPHIAYMLEGMPGFVNHAVLGSEGWQISTVLAGYFYGPLDILVDSQGVPHIHWHHHDKQNQAYAVLVDGEWEVHDIDHPGHDGWDGSLDLDFSGRPHTSSVDPSQFGSDSGVEYASFDGQSWTVEEVGSGPEPYEFGTRILLDSQDRPHIVWFDGSDMDLKYAIKDGGAWNISTVDSEGDVGRFPSLVLDERGNPAVTYFERMSFTEGYIKFARWDGEVWNIQRIDTLEDVFQGHFGARKISSLVLGLDGNPIVAYSDESVIKLARWDGTQWNPEPVLTAGDTPLGQQVSMEMDASGVLHLTFADVTAKGPHGVNGSVMYARGTPTGQ